MSDERHGALLDHLHAEQRLWIKDVAEKLQLPVETIKQDLIAMEQQGLLKRTYGGAVPVSGGRAFQAPHPAAIESSQTDSLVAKRAVSYINERDIVFLGNSGHHFLMAKVLPDRFPFTVVTNSLKIANVLKDKEHIDTYLLGGKIKPTGMATDSYSIEQLKRFCVDTCFIAGGGFSLDGVTMNTPAMAAFVTALVGVSRKTVGIAPHYRIGTEAFARAEPLQSVHVIVTDELADTETLRAFEARGVEIDVAR